MPRIAKELTALDVKRLRHPGSKGNATFAVGGVSGLLLRRSLDVETCSRGHCPPKCAPTLLKGAQVMFHPQPLLDLSSVRNVS